MSVLGHELRSPLTVIRGAATLLLQAHRDLPPEKVSELLAVIEAAAAHGWIDRRRAIEESVVAIRRAGAGAVLTYAAADVARWWHEAAGA